MSRASHHHGSLVVAREHGIFITGASGAGKTALALELVQHCSASGLFSRLVSDDQVVLFAHGPRLIGRVPPTIAGLAEARGFGPAPLAYEPAAVIDLVVSLVVEASAPRYQEHQTTTIEGIALPCLCHSGSDLRGAVRAIAARLQLPPFGCRV